MAHEEVWSIMSSFWLENIIVVFIFFLGTLFTGIVLGIWYQKLTAYFPHTKTHHAQQDHSSNIEGAHASTNTSHSSFHTTSTVNPSISQRFSYPPLPSMTLFGSKNNSKSVPDVHTQQSNNIYSRIPNYKPPKHIAVIMDGNRRFGRKKHADPLKGHWQGGQTLIDFLQWCMSAQVSIATVYAFSTENWQRDPLEVTTLMSIFIKYADTILQEALARNMRVFILSTDPDKLPQKVKLMVDKLEKETAACTGFILNICLSYGGRRELVRAFQNIVTEALTPKSETPLSAENVAERITEDTIAAHLLTRNLPEPDILIRTSGEFRLSNFLLWQLAYTEYFFLDKCWPELTEQDFFEVLAQYNQRKRRFGT